MLNHQSVDSHNCQGCYAMKNAFECALCSFLCSDESVFRAHLNAEHKSNFLPCIYCKTLYSAPHFLLRHLKSSHSLDASVYHCGSKQCSFKTISSNKFLSHLDICTVGKSIICYYCKSTFISSKFLILHMQKKLNIMLCKPYPVNNVVRVFPKYQPVSVFQTLSFVKEPSTIPVSIDQTKKPTDISSVNAATSQSVHNRPVSSASSSKKFSYILPKADISNLMEKTFQAYSVITPSPFVQQAVSVNKKVSQDENASDLPCPRFVSPIPPNVRNTSSVLNHISPSKKSIYNVSPSEKCTSKLVCQIPSTLVPSLKHSEAYKVINKITVTSAISASPSTGHTEHGSVKNALDKTRKNTNSLAVRFSTNTPKNGFMKNTTANSNGQCAIFPKFSSLNIVHLETDPPVPAKLSCTKPFSWQENAFDKSNYSIAYPEHCAGIPPKMLLVPVPQSSPVYAVRQQGISDSGTCTNLVSPAAEQPVAKPYRMQTSPNISSMLKHNNLKVTPSLCAGNINLVDAISFLSLPSSSTSDEVEIASKCNSNNKDDLLHEHSSNPKLSSMDNLSNVSLPVKLETAPQKEILRTNLAAHQNYGGTDTHSLSFSVPLSCESETSVIYSPCNVTAAPSTMGSSVVCCDNKSSYYSKLKASLPLTTELATNFSAKTEADHQAECVDSVHIKSELCENSCNTANNCHDNISATESSHKVFSRRCNKASVILSTTSTSGNNQDVIPDIKQNSPLITASHNSPSSSVCTLVPAVLSMTPVLESEPISSVLSTDTSKISYVSTSPTTSVTCVKSEVNSCCDLQSKTISSSSAFGKASLAPANNICSSSSTTKSEVQSNNHEIITQSSLQKSFLCTINKNPAITNITSLTFSEAHSSNHKALEPSSHVCDFCKRNGITDVSSTEITCNSSLTSVIQPKLETEPICSHSDRTVIESSINRSYSVSNISSHTDSPHAVCSSSNNFIFVTSSPLASQPADSSVPAKKGTVCDVAYSTIAIKPEDHLNSGLFGVPFSMTSTNCYNENSTDEPSLPITVAFQPESIARSNVCGIPVVPHAIKTCSGILPTKPATGTSLVDFISGESSDSSQCEKLISNTSLSSEKTWILHNEPPKNASVNAVSISASDMSKINVINLCDSPKTSLKHSSSSVISLHDTVSNTEQVFAISYGCQSSQAHEMLENSNPPSNVLDVTHTKVSAASMLPSTMNNTSDNVTLDEIPSNSCPCSTASSSVVDDHHPFLNSTSMTVRQILEKFRWKYKSKAKSLKKHGLKVVDQSGDDEICLNKKRTQYSADCKTSLSDSPPDAVPPSASKIILKPPTSNQVVMSLFDPECENANVEFSVSYKRKANDMLDVSGETVTTKLQNINETVTQLSTKQKENNSSVDAISEKNIKCELLPYHANKYSSSWDAHIPRAYNAGQSANEVPLNNNPDDMCSGVDILQVARELLSYDETPGETADEVVDILEALKQKKSKKALQELLQPLKLRDFFKCMAEHCSYTSSICAEFNRHLKGHEKQLFACAYCLMDFPAGDNLICHLMQEHKRSLFQCSLCFYRAFSQTQVCIHKKRFHSCEKASIIVCSPVDSFPVAFKENHMVYYAGLVQPYNCCFYNCSFSSIAMLDVIHHILYYHSTCPSYTCKECNQKNSNVFDWLIHCCVHGIHLFHCIYCAYGAESRTEMLNHISMYHANESLVIFVRSSRDQMLHLESILKDGEKHNIKKHSTVLSSSFGLMDEFQVVLENVVNTERPFKDLECLYCSYITRYILKMQEHLNSKHSQSDQLHYNFCQSQFETFSEVAFIFENLLCPNFSSEQSSIRTDMIPLDRNIFNLSRNKSTVPLQITPFKTSTGVVDLQLPLTIFQQNNFTGKYVRIFKSLFNRIKSKIQRKRFKCLYCNKREECLYKLRQHWRNCHVQTGKKFKYKITNKRWYEAPKRLSGTPSKCAHSCNALNGFQVHSSKSSLPLHQCSSSQTCVDAGKRDEKNKHNNRPAFMMCSDSNTNMDDGNQLNLSQCSQSLNIDSFSLHKKPELDIAYFNSVSCGACQLSQFIKVPYKAEHPCHTSKCNCIMQKDCLARCSTLKLCSTDMKECQIYNHEMNYYKKWQSDDRSAGISKNHRQLNLCSCLADSPKKVTCFKKCRYNVTDKHPAPINNVKLKIFLKKLPYTIKLPVLYLKKIMNLDPKVVLSVVNYKYEKKL